MLNQLSKHKLDKAHNSFILALDGDVDFKPEAVQKLIDKMKKNSKVGAVCGRIHPIGSGPVVWYQQFEYAVGHWLQKASEHVFGCVLCCPGAFSLFLMDDNVLSMYITPPSEARHFIQFEQGEDRWLCTLMLQQGWKIDYAASADAKTFAPQTFQEFFVQRRRWAPSTLANIIDLLSSWRLLGAKFEQQTDDNKTSSSNLPPMGATSVPRKETRSQEVRQNPDAWQSKEYFGLKGKGIIKEDEIEFWQELLPVYLIPINEDKQKKKEIQKELKYLRNNVAFGILLVNFLFATAIFQLQNNEDQLKSFYILNEYEPLSVTFLVVFALVILLQFIGMLIHRWGTFLHLISSVRLWSFSKAKEEDARAEKAIKVTEKMQSADQEFDYHETISLSTISHDSRVKDFDIWEPDCDYPQDDEQTNNEYGRIFRQRFETIRGNKENRRIFCQNTGAKINHAHKN
ncbi:uncharacterized protein [Mytilus edulis]|uniref:uncharacterized protein n=1 Tax=Mytilus edulis TaxID=6550 RepID=UPI0039EFC0BF